jgi:putative nucleotidyltransferase with HDIG domain/diguanylate cyclase (GGDEF)-like protein
VNVNTKPFISKCISINKKFILELILLWIAGLIFTFIGYKKMEKSILERIKMYEEGIYGLVDLVEQRDTYTAGHSKRVAKYSVMIAKEMGYKKETLDLLYKAGMLHDIGKIVTPDAVLLKPGKLTKNEFELIQEHVTTGYEFLKNMNAYKNIAEIIRYHHEKYDGTGYVEGIKGDEIPILSAIQAVADAFDAMTTNRIYKGRKDVATALKEIKELSGKQFNPKVAEAAQKALKNVKVKNVSQLPKTKLEMERFVYFFKDSLTDCFNQKYLEFVLSNNEDDEHFNYKYAVFIYLHNFGKYNKEYGWKNGDKELARIAKELQHIFSKGIIFRKEGDDFIILSKEKIEIDKEKLDSIVVNSIIFITYEEIELDKKFKEDILNTI